MARKALIQIRRGQEANIGTLAVGELGYCTDTRKLYIGAAEGNVLLANAQLGGDMLKSIYDTNNNGKVDRAELADQVAWSGIADKPAAFTPAAHTHAAAEVAESTARRFVSDTEKAAWNGKQSNLGYIPLNRAGDAMTGVLRAPAYKLDNRYMERYVGGVTLANGVANQKFDIQFPVMSADFSGWFEIDLVTSWSYANGTGRLNKRVSVFTNQANGSIRSQHAYYNYADPLVAELFALSDMWYDSTDGRYKVTVVSRSTASNMVQIFGRVMSINTTAPDIFNNVALSAIYTTDTTTYPKAVVQLPADAEVSGQQIWHAGNFNPASYVSKGALTWNQLKGV